MQIHYQEGLSLVMGFDLFGKDLEGAKICLNFLIKFSTSPDAVECFKTYLREIEMSERRVN